MSSCDNTKLICPALQEAWDKADAFRAELKTVLDREATLIERHDAKMEAAEQRAESLQAESDKWKQSYKDQYKLSNDALRELDEAEAKLATLSQLAEKVNAATFSHVDGRDLLAQLHPRHELDIKRRVDAKETWFEGDWLSDVYTAIKPLRLFLEGKPIPVAVEKAAQSFNLGSAFPQTKDSDTGESK